MVQFKDLSEEEKKILFKLNGLEYPSFPSNKIFQQFKTFNNIGQNTIPWELSLKKEIYEQEKNDFNNKVNSLLSDISFDYYETIFSQTRQLFSYLQPVKINRKQLDYFLLTEPSNSALTGFDKQEHEGWCEPPVYTLTSSRTGRMTTTSQHNILTLDKKFRKIFMSKFGDDGKLIMIDFKSLEPRLLLLMSLVNKKNKEKNIEERKSDFEDTMFKSSTLITGNPPLLPFPTSDILIPEDVYLYVMKQTKLSQVISRELIKKIILMESYSSSKSNIVSLLTQHNIEKPEEVYEIIDDFFSIDDFKKMYFSWLSKMPRKFVNNLYGRVVAIEDGNGYMATNYVVQSTAVDVALLGFMNIMNALEKIPKSFDYIRPIFCIHDALILDVHNKCEHIVPKLCDVGSKNIKYFEKNQFYLSHKSFFEDEV